MENVKSFTEYLDEQSILSEELEWINEALIQFGGKSETQFGQVVILAGGAGSGKGFVLSNLIGIQGKVFDVDALKLAAMQSRKIVDKVKTLTGTDITKLQLKKPEDVSTLHMLVGDMLALPKKQEQALYTSILTGDPRRKPNIVFDVTLKDLRKLQNIAQQVEMLGYEKKNIHIVWVVNDIEVAKAQNQSRSRTVPEEILVSTHRGASMTMKDILDMGIKLRSYMDGYIYFAFNKAKVDSTLVKSSRGGSWVKKANYVKVKERGKAQTPSFKLTDEVKRKIAAYTPKAASWT